ncbi:MAG: glycosyltransferase family 9 protein [Candidatus Caenarcaniphilales bacterium]|nr:glycosyltransferase family 9 protein [Candidatus Caenarcaniphilales bacterium]
MENPQPEPKIETKNKKLLFIHPGGLGDVVLLLPALQNLRDGFEPDWQIDLLVEKRAYQGSLELFSINKIVDKVKTFDFKNKYALLQFPELIRQIGGYSTVISSGSSPLVSLLLFFSGAKKRVGFKSNLDFLLTDPIKLNKEQYAARMLWELTQPLTRVITQKTDKEKAIPQLKLDTKAIPVEGLLTGRYLLIHPGVSVLSIIKRIIKTPGSFFWSDLIDKLDQKLKNTDIKIALVAGPDEKEIAKEIIKNCKSASNKIVDLSESSFSLPELIQLIAGSAAFVCADSAPLHLGICVGANIVALFGPTDPNKLLPNANDYTSLYGGNTLSLVKVTNLLCQPCLWNRRSQSCGAPICVDWQDPNVVLEALSGVLDLKVAKESHL